MSDTTPRLNLPLVGDHSQKRIVMNEGLMRLESLVQAQVLSRTTAVEPAGPADGDAYILPADATGTSWSGLAAGAFVRSESSTWESVVFPNGALVHIADENRFVLRSGSGWAAFEDVLKVLDNLAHLGIGTTADTTNVLALKGPAALLSGVYAAGGGNGDISLALNKEGDGDTAQILLQRDYATRAVLGLVGDNNLTLKVSPDGATFITALSVNATTGVASLSDSLLAVRASADTTKVAQFSAAGLTTATTRTFALPDISATLAHTGAAAQTFGGASQWPAGSVSAPALRIGASTTGVYSNTSASLDGALAGNRRLVLYESGNTVSLRVGDIDTSLNGAAAFVMRRSGNSSAGANVLAISDVAGQAIFQALVYGSQTPILSGAHGRGTQASPAYPNANDVLLSIRAAATTTTIGSNTSVGLFDFTVIAATPSASDLQMRASLSLAPAGSTTASEILRLDHASGLSMYGANPVIDQNRNVRSRIYTVATLPTAATAAGQRAQVSDAASPSFAVAVSGGGSTHSPVYSDGSTWRCG